MNLVTGVSLIILGLGLIAGSMTAGVVVSILADGIAGFVLEILFSRKDAAFKHPVRCSLGVLVLLSAAAFAAFESHIPPAFSFKAVTISDLPLYAMFGLGVASGSAVLVEKCIHRIRDTLAESVRRGEPMPATSSVAGTKT